MLCYLSFVKNTHLRTSLPSINVQIKRKRRMYKTVKSFDSKEGDASVFNI